MNPKNTPDTGPPAPGGETTPNPWLSPRRLRFWAVLAVLTYTLGGFFLAPVLVEKLAVDGVRDSMGRDLVLGKVRINPYVLSADIENLELQDTDGEAQFSLGHFHANFQLSSLFRWALTFREIRFDEPHLLYERFAPEDDRITRLLADIERLEHLGCDLAQGYWFARPMSAEDVEGALVDPPAWWIPGGEESATS